MSLTCPLFSLRTRLPVSSHMRCQQQVQDTTSLQFFLFEHIVPKVDWQTWCPPWLLSSCTSVICSSQFFCYTLFLLYHWFIHSIIWFCKRILKPKCFLCCLPFLCKFNIITMSSNLCRTSPFPLTSTTS